MATISRSLDSLDDDTVIYLFSFLSVSDILVMRLTCKRFMVISKLRTVWNRLYLSHIQYRGLYFGDRRLEVKDADEFERVVRHAIRVSKKWTDFSLDVRVRSHFSGSPISTVRFLPGRKGRWIITISTGIWSMVSCWYLRRRQSGGHRSAVKMAEWSARGALIDSLEPNTDASSEGTMAISTEIIGRGRKICILSLRCGNKCPDFKEGLRPIFEIPASNKVVALRGNTVVMSNTTKDTTVMDWRTGECAVLRDVGRNDIQASNCVQVIFAHQCILVVRARSMSLFSNPTSYGNGSSVPIYDSIADYSFGWLDNISVAEQVSRPTYEDGSLSYSPLYILIRHGTDDPWEDDHSINLHSLAPDPTYDPTSSLGFTNKPYIFPPQHIYTHTCARGYLRCTSLALGAHGTAFWIQPREHASHGLTTLDVHAQETQLDGPVEARETLVAGLFRGPLLGTQEEATPARIRPVWGNREIGWVSMDYDEGLGMVVLGSGTGKVLVLEL